MVPLDSPPALAGVTWEAGGPETPAGFWLDGIDAGLRGTGVDMALLVSRRPAVVAGMFTTNSVQAAPVILTRGVAAHGVARAVVVNAKNANALTGDRGLTDAEAMQRATAEGLELSPDEVAVASTGVIGVPLPMDRILAGVRGLTLAYRSGRPGDGRRGAEAILTTDTAPKTLAATVALSRGTVRLGMMVKGSGMIHPGMATMLAFLTTDAEVPSPDLDRALRDAVARSFHCVTVDGDQSTNDMVLLFANGASGVSLAPADDRHRFGQALSAMAREGARMIAADGEGATHLLTVRVEGAQDAADAALKARAVARSALVKAAVYGRDPNWGRILAAAGSAGTPFDPRTVSLYLGDAPLFVRGEPAPPDEARWSARLAAREVEFRLDLGQGDGAGEAFGCDLTEGYVAINAHYRT